MVGNPRTPYGPPTSLYCGTKIGQPGTSGRLKNKSQTYLVQVNGGNFDDALQGSSGLLPFRSQTLAVATPAIHDRNSDSGAETKINCASMSAYHGA